MQKYLIPVYAVLLTLLASGCSLVPIYRPTIEQGNVISQESVAQLKPGMTRDQVIYLLGSPVLTSNFNTDRWDYVYTLKPSTGIFEQKRVTLYFIGNRLDHILVAVS
jgi:outer membrane protein assembly factor BamE